MSVAEAEKRNFLENDGEADKIALSPVIVDALTKKENKGKIVEVTLLDKSPLVKIFFKVKDNVKRTHDIPSRNVSGSSRDRCCASLVKRKQCITVQLKEILNVPLFLEETDAEDSAQKADALNELVAASSFTDILASIAQDHLENEFVVNAFAFGNEKERRSVF